MEAQFCQTLLHGSQAEAFVSWVTLGIRWLILCPGSARVYCFPYQHVPLMTERPPLFSYDCPLLPERPNTPPLLQVWTEALY